MIPRHPVSKVEFNAVLDRFAAILGGSQALGIEPSMNAVVRATKIIIKLWISGVQSRWEDEEILKEQIGFLQDEPGHFVFVEGGSHATTSL